MNRGVVRSGFALTTGNGTGRTGGGVGRGRRWMTTRGGSTAGGTGGVGIEGARGRDCSTIGRTPVFPVGAFATFGVVLDLGRGIGVGSGGRKLTRINRSGGADEPGLGGAAANRPMTQNSNTWNKSEAPPTAHSGHDFCRRGATGGRSSGFRDMMNR